MDSNRYGRNLATPEFSSDFQMSNYDRALAEQRMHEAMALADLTLRTFDSVKESVKAAGRAVRRVIVVKSGVTKRGEFRPD